MSDQTPRQASSLEKENALDIVFTAISSGGRITAEKLRAVVQDLGHDFTEEEIEEMIEVADPSGKGKVDYKSMVTMIKENKEEFPAVPMSMEEIRRELTMIRSETTMVSRAQTRNETRMSNVKVVRENDEVDTISLTHRIPVDVANNGEQHTHDKDNVADANPDSNSADDGHCHDASNDNGDDVEDGDNTARDTHKDGNANNANNDADSKAKDKCEDNANDGGQGNVDQRIGSSRGSHVVSHSLDDPVVTALGVYGAENTALEGELKNEQGAKKLNKRDGDGDARSLSIQNMGKKGKKPKTVGKQQGKGITLVRSQSMNNINNQTQPRAGIPDVKKAGRFRNNSIRHGPVPKRHSVAVVQPEQSTDLSMVKGTGIKKQPVKVVHHHHHHHHYHKQNAGDNSTPRTDRDGPSRQTGFGSAMGCALKLSQVRMRQRLLCVLWRQVYDEAMKASNNAKQTQPPVQTKKKKGVRGRHTSLTLTSKGLIHDHHYD